MSVHKFVKLVGILLLNDSWFRLFCNSYMFGVVICHICAFISNRTRTFEWMIVSFLNYIWNYLKFIWLFLKLIWTIWNPFGYFWNWFELSEIHLEFSEFDLNYLKFICTFLNSTWTIWNSFGFFWIRPEKGVVVRRVVNLVRRGVAWAEIRPWVRGCVRFCSCSVTRCASYDMVQWLHHNCDTNT